MMQQNRPIIATITTLGTLMGLLDTVIGMIRSFAALSAGGGADSMHPMHKIPFYFLTILQLFPLHQLQNFRIIPPSLTAKSHLISSNMYV